MAVMNWEKILRTMSKRIVAGALTCDLPEHGWEIVVASLFEWDANGNYLIIDELIELEGNDLHRACLKIATDYYSWRHSHKGRFPLWMIERYINEVTHKLVTFEIHQVK